MNRCVPDWNMEDKSTSLHDLLPVSNRKKSAAPDDELVELVWRNGHVVMQSQGNRKPPATVPEPKFDPSLKHACSVGNSSNLIQDDGPSSWFQYPLDDPLERDFSEFFSGIPVEDTVDTNKQGNDVFEEGERNARFSVSEETNTFTMPMPPPKFGSTQKAPSLGNSGFLNILSYSRPPTDELGSGSGVVVGIGESSSAWTVGSSACGSNKANRSNGATVVRGSRVKDVPMNPLHEGAQTMKLDPTVTTSSSGWSGCSFGRTVGQQSASNQNHKRKGRHGEDSECHSEEADHESIDANRPSQRSGSTRKSRAAEVHNLSERRRRDRINEKMKALQELVPHCNKSDKASMLDEAIEYLKSLQLQLQIMWMGSGMAPMMFHGVQPYMSRVGIGMGHASSMASINNPIQLTRAPPVNHSTPSTANSGNQMPMCQSPVLNPMNFQPQMQNAHLPEPYARYLGFPHMQLAPQAMNLYAYGSHMAQQQNQTTAAVGSSSSSSLPTAGIPSEKIQNGQSG